MPHITRLESERRAAGLSQADLAFTAKIAQATVSKIEQLKLRTPSHALLERLARALRHHGRSKVTAGDLDPGTPVVVRPRRRPTTKPKSLATANADSIHPVTVV